MAKRICTPARQPSCRQSLPMEVIECYRCDDEFVGAMWQIRCNGWEQLSVIEGRTYGMCRKCVEIEKQLRARGYTV
jgi:hypothetical protein